MTEYDWYQNTDGCLYIDIGNTRIKAAIHTKKGWQVVFNGASSDDFLSFKDFAETIPSVIQKAVVASVIRNWQEVRRHLNARHTVTEIAVPHVNPAHLDYKTPGTLGIDRFLACLGAWSHNRKDVIVVDAGTACTIDLMDANGVFRGGYITPGLSVREKGLYEFAPSLPGVPRVIPDTWPGKSTAESLQWGLTGGFVSEVYTAIQQYRRDYANLEIWLTGGDAILLKEHLAVECHIDPNLVFEGMRSFPSITRKEGQKENG